MPLAQKIKLRLEHLVQKLLSSFDLVLIRSKTFQTLQRDSSRSRILRILQECAPSEGLEQFWELSATSKAQLGQDLLAVLVSNFKRGGFFVEFGATDGEKDSNTFILEKELGWQGILAEPARVWHSKLSSNRSSAISDLAVWATSGQELLFHEDAELSTIDGFERLKHDARSGVTYKVKTISLNDLLSSLNAPRFIDFLSVDTEGSEFEILSSLDWSKWSFGLICVEHNGTEFRPQIFELMTQKGYKRILEDVSGWDDWYVPVNPQSPGVDE
jgi:FkbM family methyltransferase